MIREGTAANTVTSLPTEDDWRQRAVCREVEPEIFFPDSTLGPSVAKAICAGCPVRPACLDWALAVPEEHGVFGGLDERERKVILRKRGVIKPRTGGRQPSPCGTRKAYERHIRNNEPIDEKCATEGRHKQWIGDKPKAAA